MTEEFVRKRCPRCGGNVYIDRDYHGWYEKCFQCAYTHDLKNVVKTKEKINHDSNRLIS